MSNSWVATAAFTASFALAATLGPYGAAGSSILSPPEGHGETSSASTVVSAASPPPGVLAYVSDSDYYGSGGEEKLATVLPDGTQERTLLAPANVGFGLLEFSPDGRRLAYFHDSQSGAVVEVMDIATRKVGTVLRLRGSTAYLDGLAWTSGGRDLIVASNQRPGSSTVHSETALWRVPVAGGTPKELTSFEDAGDPVVLPDGDLVYVVSKTFSSASLDKSAVWTSSPTGSHPNRLFTSSHFVHTPAVSPNGFELAFSVLYTKTTMHLQSFTMASRHRKDLTPLVKGRTDISPSWSPNGSQIVFLSSRAGRHAATESDQLLDAYVMTATGKHPRKVISRGGDEWSMVAVAWGA
jgi:Tol biopolymer transport system component